MHADRSLWKCALPWEAWHSGWGFTLGRVWDCNAVHQTVPNFCRKKLITAALVATGWIEQTEPFGIFFSFHPSPTHLLELFLGIQSRESSQHRSHFGSRYKLGCCGHAGLFDLGSIPPGCLLLGPLGSLLFPNSQKSPFVELGLFFSS